jgi:Na+/proline symporter
MIIGIFVIIYVTSGGTKAVSLTQRQQMAIIMGGMILAGFIAYQMLPENVSFSDSVALAGALGKFNLVNLDFHPDDRYNIWSGLIAGTFLSLAYFGTDQSQVARYLSGRSIAESRMGLIFNGLLKIPMQFIILFIGVMVFVFFLFNKPPVFYNEQLKNRAIEVAADPLNELESDYNNLFEQKSVAIQELVKGLKEEDEVLVEKSKASYESIDKQERQIRESFKKVIADNVAGAKTRDTDYIFLNFVINHLPNGIVGLLLAVMFSAAMSSMASELNALASTTTVDVYKRTIRKDGTPEHYLHASRAFTVMWALLAILFSVLAGFSENLIQFVNIVGSLFYGTILGIFITAFYIKRVKANAVFVAGLISQSFIFYCYFFTEIAYLWYNIIGCGVVVILGLLFQILFGRKETSAT